jgi:hypothetical protein
LFTNFEAKLVKYILEKQGLTELLEINGTPVTDALTNAPTGSQLLQNVAVIWSSSVIKQNIYSQLGRFTKINHFPRTYEITRKDSLSERFAKMQALYGERNFNFMPQ